MDSAVAGPVTIKSRAVDDSGNLESLRGSQCHRSREPDDDLVEQRGTRDRWMRTDTLVELGVKFYSEVGGAIKGIRFYKSPCQHRNPRRQPVVGARCIAGVGNIYG